MEYYELESFDVLFLVAMDFVQNQKYQVQCIDIRSEELVDTFQHWQIPRIGLLKISINSFSTECLIF